MNNLNNTQKENLKKYVLSNIDTNYYDFEAKTDKERVQFVLNCFEKEYNYFNNKKRYPNLTNRVASWLQGLPGVFEVAFYNGQILELGLKFGLIDPGISEDKETDFINIWFELCAASFLEIAKELGINTNYLK